MSNAELKSRANQIISLGNEAARNQETEMTQSVDEEFQKGPSPPYEDLPALGLEEPSNDGHLPRRFPVHHLRL